MSRFDIDIHQQLLQAEKHLNFLSEKAAVTAKVQAINRVATRIKGQSAKATASAVKVKQKTIRKRITIKKASTKVLKGKKTAVTYATIFVKRRDVPAISLGKARQTKKGVRVGGRLFQGAFLADGSKGFGKYIPLHRRGRAMSHPYGTTKLRTMHVLKRLGSFRNSVTVIGVPIKSQITQIVTQKTTSLMNTDMPKELKQAMSHQVRLIINKGIRRGY